MGKKEVIILSYQYLDKLIIHYGESKFQSTTPYISVENSKFIDAHDSLLKGEFCRILNEIIIYWKNIYSKEELLQTLIHEYTHYLQSPRWMTRYYTMGYDYSNHPYELKAYREEQNWKKIIGYEI